MCRFFVIFVVHICNDWTHTLWYYVGLCISNFAHPPLVLLPATMAPITLLTWMSSSMPTWNPSWVFKSTTASVSSRYYFQCRKTLLFHLHFNAPHTFRCSWKLLLPERKQWAVLPTGVLPECCKSTLFKHIPFSPSAAYSRSLNHTFIYSYVGTWLLRPIHARWQ